MNKIVGILVLALALVIGIVPLFTDCLANGKSLQTADGRSVPMKCHWTAIAEIGIAIPLGLAGIFTAVSKRKETRTMLAVLGTALGALVVLFPTVLIGVCANAMMPCNLVEKPLLILGGILAMAASLFGLLNARKTVEIQA